MIIKYFLMLDTPLKQKRSNSLIDRDLGGAAPPPSVTR